MFTCTSDMCVKLLLTYLLTYLTTDPSTDSQSTRT